MWVSFRLADDVLCCFLQVQDIVVGAKNFTDVAKPSEIMQLLLNEEQLATLDSTSTSGPSQEPGNASGDVIARDLWNEEGDDFFGHTGPTSGLAGPEVADDEAVPTAATRGKKRKQGTGAPRGRKPGKRKLDGSAPL